MDTRTAVWISTAEKFSKSFGENLGVLSKVRGVSAPTLYKNLAVHLALPNFESWAKEKLFKDDENAEAEEDFEAHPEKQSAGGSAQILA